MDDNFKCLKSVLYDGKYRNMYKLNKKVTDDFIVRFINVMSNEYPLKKIVYWYCEYTESRDNNNFCTFETDSLKELEEAMMKHHISSVNAFFSSLKSNVNSNDFTMNFFPGQDRIGVIYEAKCMDNKYIEDVENKCGKFL